MTTDHSLEYLACLVKAPVSYSKETWIGLG